MEEKRYPGWHFLAEPRLAHGDGRAVTVGRVLSVDGDIIPCEWGLHAASDLAYATIYAPTCSRYVCRVEVWGDVRFVGASRSKMVGRHRKVLGMLNLAQVRTTLWKEFKRRTGASLDWDSLVGKWAPIDPLLGNRWTADGMVDAFASTLFVEQTERGKRWTRDRVQRWDDAMKIAEGALLKAMGIGADGERIEGEQP